MRKKRAVKGIVTRPSQQRGGLKRRAEQQNAANHQDRATNVKVPYDDTKYVRLEGFEPISINQQDLQCRFDRWLDKTKGLVQDAEERAEKAESLDDAAQERMSLKDRVISQILRPISITTYEDADDEGAEKDYVILCCRQVYRPAMGALVECSHCLNWFHLRPVCSCPGESITKAKAKQRHNVHTCSLCNKDPSRKVAVV